MDNDPRVFEPKGQKVVGDVGSDLAELHLKSTLTGKLDRCSVESFCDDAGGFQVQLNLLTSRIQKNDGILICRM